MRCDYKALTAMRTLCKRQETWCLESTIVVFNSPAFLGVFEHLLASLEGSLQPLEL